MIDNIFLDNAVKIRRTYLKLTNNLSLYHDNAKKILVKLDDTIAKINDIKERLNNDSGDKNEKYLNELIDVLKEVEKEGLDLEKIMEPINKEIENLSKEETILYNKIKEKYNELTDDVIIETIRKRLELENLI